MKTSVLFAVFATLLLVGFVKADCDEKKEGDSDVTTWLKNVGCKIQKGGEEVVEQTKPWADKIGSAAKDLGHSIAEKYNDIKHKITEGSQTENVEKVSAPAPVANAPTEKVPLAPIQSPVPADLLKN